MAETKMITYVPLRKAMSLTRATWWALTEAARRGEIRARLVSRRFWFFDKSSLQRWARERQGIRAA